jgi:anthranilate phosphoribosyltransferase
MTDRLGELEEKLRKGENISYEEGADIFELTITGKLIMQQNQLDHAAILALLRSRFPTVEALSESLRQMFEAYDNAAKRAH